MIATDIIARARFNDESLRTPTAEQFARRGRAPHVVAQAIVQAIRRGTAVVPVGGEAWLAYYGKRAAPGLAERVARQVDDMTQLVSRVRDS
jgi:hypothetical protein